MSDAYDLIHKQRVPESKKTREYFEALCRYYVPYVGFAREEYVKMRALYRLVNNDLSGIKDQLRAYCAPTTAESLFEVPEHEFLAFNEIFSKTLLLKGEMQRRGVEFVVALRSEIDREAKAAEVKKRINEAMDRAVARIAAAAQQSRSEAHAVQQQASMQLDEDVREAVSHPSAWEKFNQVLLRNAYGREDLTEKRMLSLAHQLCSGIVCVRVGRSHGRTTLEPVNSLHCGFDKSPDEVRIERADAFWETDTMTLREVLLQYGSTMKAEDRKRLEERAGLRGGGVGRAWADYAQGSLGVVAANQGQKPGAPKTENTYRSYGAKRPINGAGHERLREEGHSGARGPLEYHHDANDLCSRTRLEVKLLKRVRLLKTVYPDNFAVEDFVPGDFKIPKDADRDRVDRYGTSGVVRHRWSEGATDYECLDLWIPRRYFIDRIDEDIVADFGEVAGQPDYVEDPFNDFELSVKGRAEPAVNAELVSPIARALPPYIQYLIVKNLMTRELGKFQGAVLDVDTATMPEWIKEYSDGDDHLGGFIKVLRKLGLNVKDSSMLEDANIRHTNSSGQMRSANQASELLALSQLAEVLRIEIGLAMGIAPQRESQMVAETASDNRQAENASYFMTEPLFFNNAKVWRAATEEYLMLRAGEIKRKLRMAGAARTLSLSYLTDTEDEAVLKVTPETFGAFPCVLHLAEARDTKTYREAMLREAQAFAQNQGQGMEEVSRLVQLITSGASPSEIHRDIQRISRDQRNRIEAQEQARQKAEAAAQQELLAAQAKKDQSAHLSALEQKQLDVNGKIAVADRNLSGVMGSAGIRRQTELEKIALGRTDEDGVNDELEGIKAAKEIQAIDRREAREDKRLVKETKEAEAAVLRDVEDLRIKEKQVDKPTTSAK